MRKAMRQPTRRAIGRALLPTALGLALLLLSGSPDAVAADPARASGAVPTGQAAEPACGAPAELLEAAAPLPATARAVQAGRLRLLVVGTASAFGPGTSAPSAAWPAQLEAWLLRRFPGLAVELRVRGGRGLATAEAAALIAAEMPGFRPHLVIWQTGTVEAVRGIELDLVTQTMDEAVARVLAAGADLVLMDQQFSRFLRANANIDPYRDQIRLVAAAHGVPVLRRYELMRFWVESERVDLERAPRELRVAVADRLNACIAEATGKLLRSGMAEARGKATGSP